MSFVRHQRCSRPVDCDRWGTIQMEMDMCCRGSVGGGRGSFCDSMIEIRNSVVSFQSYHATQCVHTAADAVIISSIICHVAPHESPPLVV